MAKKPGVIIGEQETNLSPEQELAILKARNGKFSFNGATLAERHLGNTMFSTSYTGGISHSMFDNVNVDWIQHRNIIERYFVNIFDWKGLEPEFQREFERILFRHGKCAVVKLPDGGIYPAQYSFDDNDTDYYGNPNNIRIQTKNSFNNTKVKKGDFVLVYNNHERRGTLTFLYERLRQTIRALIDVDNAMLLARPKWGANISIDDAAWQDVMDALHSDLPVVPLGNIDFKDAGIEDMTGVDQSDSKMNVYKFQLTTMLKLIGLKVNSGEVKKERQTEMELVRNDEFDEMLFTDMFRWRERAVKELNALGLKCSIEINDIIEGEDPEKDEANGEVNKVKNGDN